MRWIAALVLALVVSGCAKYPSSSAGRTTRLVFTMTTDGHFRTGLGPGESGLPYIYIVALKLNTDENPTTDGPFPVVQPGGNGFVAGGCTHYILWNPLASPQYQIWQFNDATLNQSFYVGAPVNYQTLGDNDKTMSFEVDLSQLVPAGQVDTIKSVQVNFLTMNNQNVSGGGRLWDALGDSTVTTQINSPFLVRLRANQTFTNANQGTLEPRGDCPDPDLDLTDWSVEVRLP
ncbi:MAG: hypothetical protein KF857_10995 [Fimbriimonadaceae bacterium]|nr:hypothetical protein [Fimbriimonadaceae bacterium]